MAKTANEFQPTLSAAASIPRKRRRAAQGLPAFTGQNQQTIEEKRMALPLLQIARLLAQLTTVGPVVTESADKIRRLVETLRRSGGDSVRQLDALREAAELQSAVNKKVDDQLQIIESVLAQVQKSLKILTFTSAAAAILALAALGAALLE
jgi:hypothetical protein